MGVEEDAKDLGAVLASGQAEVGEQGHRSAHDGAQKAANGDAHGGLGVGKQRPALVEAVTMEPVAVGTEGADESLGGDEHVRIGEVGIDSPPNGA